MTNKHKPTAYLYIPVVCNKSRDSGTLCKLRWEECCDVCEKESNKCTENKFGTCQVIPCRADCGSICDDSPWTDSAAVGGCGCSGFFPYSKKKGNICNHVQKENDDDSCVKGLIKPLNSFQMSENNFDFICPWEYSIELYFYPIAIIFFFFTETLLLSGQV